MTSDGNDIWDFIVYATVGGSIYLISLVIVEFLDIIVTMAKGPKGDNDEEDSDF